MIIRRVIFFTLGFIGCSLLMEFFLSRLPVSTGYRFLPVTQNNPVLRGTPGFKYVYSKNWNMRLATKGSLNNFGFPADYDYVPSTQSISIIGDSYIQASAIKPEHKLYALLDRHLRPHTRVYGLGISGANLADYLAMTKWAAEELHSQTIIILLIEDDLHDSTFRRAGGYHIEKQNNEYTLIRTDNNRRFMWLADFLLQSSLFRYYFDNLTFASNFKFVDYNSEKNIMHQLNNKNPAEEEVIAFILQEFSSLEKDYNLKLQFILNPQRTNSTSPYSFQDRDIDQFASAAHDCGFSVMHLDKAFDDYMIEMSESMDFTPTDHHWNVAAHRVVALQILQSRNLPNLFTK